VPYMCRAKRRPQAHVDDKEPNFPLSCCLQIWLGTVAPSREAMAHQDRSSPMPIPVILHCGLGVLSVALAVVSALLLQRFELTESLFLMAIAVTVWFGGMGPGLLAIEHRGRLWATDNSPRGAVFYVGLPTKVEAGE